MKRDAVIFAAVTVVSLAVAHVCHTYFPGVAPAIKPMAWPFVYLAYLTFKYARRHARKRP